jgi:hypothetical protein
MVCACLRPIKYYFFFQTKLKHFSLRVYDDVGINRHQEKSGNNALQADDVDNSVTCVCVCSSGIFRKCNNIIIRKVVFVLNFKNSHLKRNLKKMSRFLVEAPTK